MSFNIVIDENVSFADEAFGRFGNVIRLKGRDITNSMLINADALIVRSVTKVNEELLSGSKVKFVGTATIGSDHIDKAYLEANSIDFADARGCNANAVAEYFLTSLFYTLVKNNLSLKRKKIGIVGVGNIGSRVRRFAEILGLDIVLNDPPLKEQTDSDVYRSLDEILECDIITIHTPLTYTCKYPTYHLFDKSALSRLKEGTIFINSARGEVVDNLALLDELKKKKIYTVLDVWESEPHILSELLSLTEVATPHIAGYSLEGKINGTKMMYDAFCSYFDFKPLWEPTLPSIDDNHISLIKDDSDIVMMDYIFRLVYPIQNDDYKLRQISNIALPERGLYFDSLRRDYPLRREFTNYQISNIYSCPELKEVLEQFGFRT